MAAEAEAAREARAKVDIIIIIIFIIIIIIIFIIIQTNSREGHLTLMEEFLFFLTGQFHNGFALTRHFSKESHNTSHSIELNNK